VRPHLRVQQPGLSPPAILIEKAVCKTIDDEELIFVSIPELQGAWATGMLIRVL
jgi:hypothetical protein